MEDLSPNLALLKLIIVDKTDAVVLAQSILKTADTQEERRRRLDLVEAILVNKFPQLSTDEILKMLNLKTADIKETRYIFSRDRLAILAIISLDITLEAFFSWQKQQNNCNHYGG